MRAIQAGGGAGGVDNITRIMGRSHGRGYPQDIPYPYPYPWDIPNPLDIPYFQAYNTPLLLISGGHHWRPVQTCSLDPYLSVPTPLLLTSSGGHRNLFRCKAGSKHPTGMLYCTYRFEYPPTPYIKTEGEYCQWNNWYNQLLFIKNMTLEVPLTVLKTFKECFYMISCGDE